MLVPDDAHARGELRGRPAWSRLVRSRLAREGIFFAAVVLVAVVLMRTGAVWRLLALRDKPRGEGIRECRTLTGVGPFWGPHWSPDGSQVAYLEYEERPLSVEEMAARTGGENGELITHLEVVPVSGGAPRRVGRFWDLPFQWGKDSRSVVYLLADVRPSPDGGHSSSVMVSLRRLLLESGREVEVASASFRLWERGVWISRGDDSYTALSPDGSQVAFIAWTQTGEGPRSYAHDLAVLHLPSGRLHLLPRLRDGAGQEVVPGADLTWAGDRLYFAAGHSGRLEIWSVRKDGSDSRQETQGPKDTSPAPRPGGTELAFVRDGSICLREADGNVRTLVQAERANGRSGQCLGRMTWSPDGSHIAFTWAGKRTPGLSIWAARVVPAAGGK